ncbi:DM10 domain-containing protein [Plasmodiophora brassicae]
MASSDPRARAHRVPLLPGHVINTTVGESFHRGHLFDICNGIRTEKASTRSPSSAPTCDPASTTATRHDNQVRQDKKVNDASPRVSGLPMSTLPPWIAYANRVLRLYAYYKEAVNESAVETWRVRRCTILYYLEDGTLQVNEVDEVNSGLTHGAFMLKRHRVPVPGQAPGRFLAPGDLRVGSQVDLYGRRLHIYDADQWTRAFFDNDDTLGTEPPQDPFHERLTQLKSSSATTESASRFAEALHGKPSKKALERSRKMLANMGTVLRFWARLEDQDAAPADESSQAFILHYFVEDDTVEIVRDKQCSKGASSDAARMLLRRQALPRRFTMAGAASIGMDHSETVGMYTAGDLRIGAVIEAYGRRLRLLRADRFTKDYYKATFGLSDADLADLVVGASGSHQAQAPKPTTSLSKSQVETAASSEASSFSLQFGSPARKRRSPGFQMRFLASLSSSSTYDVDRRFVVTFDIGTDELSVYETVQANSGFTGGKMMEKSSARINPTTGQPFVAGDMQVGASIVVNGFRFHLLQADDATLRYMKEQHPNE